MSIVINGSRAPLPDDPRVSLLDYLRERLELFGTKKGCDQGACGACTVLVDGQRILSCLSLAVQHEGREVTTIEGLATSELHPLQQAFIDHDGFQCGYCTPGQICSAVAMVDELRRSVPSYVTSDLKASAMAMSREEIQERMSGNLCRCGAYNGIIEAISQIYAKEFRMTPFAYVRATDIKSALNAHTVGAKYLGGGTNLIDLMRETIERPAKLIDVCHLSDSIEETSAGGLRIGAASRNTSVAEHHLIRTRYPVLSRAIVAGASAQIRNMATVGGNILQRTRCPYFYDDHGARCNKRSPGEGCDAIEGFNRNHAILGASNTCIATHPSDMCVALSVLDARVQMSSVRGERAIDLNELYSSPNDRPDVETVLEVDELITAIEIPKLSPGMLSTYRKVRDRASYAFALISVAAAMEVEAGRIKDIRLALGGVAYKPWRAFKAEASLRGALATPEVFRAAAERELEDARPFKGNGFKIPLAVRTISAVLSSLAEARA